ncbi:MAG: hypothetical protein ABIN58_13685, partial [candidate division WOR-3 bacterium]
MIRLLAWTSRDLPWPLASIIGGAFGLNPAYALLTMQGLETTLTGFLVLLAGFLSLRICLQPTRAFMAWWSALMVVAFLARPDTAVFFAANF